MLSRRRFTLSLGSLAVAGCCTRRYPTASSILDTSELVSPSSFLAPLQRTQIQSSATSKLIDAHAHFFNASDVPVRDFLGQSIAHSQRPLVRELLELLAPLATLLTESAPTAKQEYDELASFEKTMRVQRKSGDPRLLKAAWEERIQREVKSTAERVIEVTRKSRFLKSYLKHKSASSPSARAKSGSISQLGIEEILRAVELNRGNYTGIQSATVAADTDSASQADGVLGFLFYLLSPRSNNIEAHRSAFHDNAENVQATIALGSLVDFDYWQGCAPPSSHDDQIQLHAVLSKSSGGYMKPLLAYNPWTDIKLDGEGLRRVKRAMKTNDFAGVKIYPPSGFSPGDNSQFTTKKPRPDAAQLDVRLDAFFDYCAQEGVVVMAHTNHSSGRDFDHDKLSSPDEWRKRFSKHNDPKHPLFVNLGHYGGEVHENWTQDFAQLMVEFPHHKIYADIGFWDALIKTDKDGKKARQRLLDSFDTEIEQTGETVGNRVMYGTDWFMLSIVSKWSSYQPLIHQWLVDEIGGTKALNIVYNNARTFFGDRI